MRLRADPSGAAIQALSAASFSPLLGTALCYHPKTDFNFAPTITLCKKAAYGLNGAVGKIIRPWLTLRSTIRPVRVSTSDISIVVDLP
jgi:hypothetical protein